MPGLHAQLLSQVVRRDLMSMPSTYPDHKGAPMSPTKMISGGLALAVVLFVFFSVDYIIGSVMASMTMIESPTSTTYVVAQPPAYSEEPDAPLEKAPILDTSDKDVEVTVVNHKLITARIGTTVKHLRRVGGFRALWRGFGQNILYHISVNVTGHIIGSIVSLIAGRGIGHFLGYTLGAVAMCRVHMLWTHAMIAMPTSTPWYRRFVPRKQCKALLLPAFVFSLAEQATIVLPIAVAFVLGLPQFAHDDAVNTIRHMPGCDIALLILRVLAVPATAIFVALAIYLPAAATLIRIEACLLPEDQETIVPFDREAIIGDLDLTQRGSAKKLFLEAWKSFNGAARLRLVKLFVKLFSLQVAVFMLAGLSAIFAL